MFLALVILGHLSKTPFKASFKNRFFWISYPHPRSGALAIAIVSASVNPDIFLWNAYWTMFVCKH